MLRDLHSHTFYSDGSLAPQDLIQRAHEAGIAQLAITDHDSIDGILSVQDELDKLPLQLVNGVEISANWGSQGVHIVGLNIDPNNTNLQAFLTKQQEGRKQRALEIALKLEKAGVTKAVSDVEGMVESQPMVCRTHLAQYLIDTGVVNNFTNAFKKYLAKGARAFVKDQWFATDDAIAIIQHAGGQAVLAHPTRYKMGSNRLQQMVKEFAESGGDGIEVSYPNMQAGHNHLLASWATRYGLLASQGSDFHCPEKTWARLGKFAPLPEGVKPIWDGWNAEIDLK